MFQYQVCVGIATADEKEDLHEPPFFYESLFTYKGKRSRLSIIAYRFYIMSSCKFMTLQSIISKSTSQKALLEWLWNNVSPSLHKAR